MNSFSPNMLKTFENCQKKYYFKYVQNISVPQPVSFFEKGKNIHALANYYLRGTDISSLLPALSDEEKQIWGRLLNNEFFQKTYVNSEYNLSAKINDFWIGGRLDALMRDGDDYFILDYKTGAIPKNPEYDYQTMVYLICADRVLKVYNSLKFVYIDLKNNKNYVINFDSDKKVEYINALTLLCAKISQTTEFGLSTDKCKFCEYSKLCY